MVVCCKPGSVTLGSLNYPLLLLLPYDLAHFDNGIEHCYKDHHFSDLGARPVTKCVATHLWFLYYLTYMKLWDTVC